MKKAKVWKWIAATGTSLLFLFTFIFSMTGGVVGTTTDDVAENTSGPITAQAAAVNYEDFSGDNFSRFKEGAMYCYTEATLARNFHNAYMLGNTPSDGDLKDVKVSISAARGTEQNPYVITNVTEWNAFAAMASNYNQTTGKFFALGCDIDANNGPINPLPYFAGVFCGNGYMIDKVVQTNPTATGNARGLFNNVQNATISDLRLVIKYNCSNVYTYHGGLIGYIANTTNILNCQTDVTWSQTAGTAGRFGGIAGGTAAVPVLVYRGSSFFTFTMSTGTGNGAIYGGLFGGTTGAVTMSMFDSTARTISDLGASTASRYSGGIIGILESSTNANLTFENVISDIDAKSGKVVWDAAIAHTQANTAWPKSTTLTNVYASGTDTVGTTVTSRYVITCGSGQHQTNVRNGSNYKNVHSTKVYNRLVDPNGFTGVDDYNTSTLKYYVEAITGTTQADAENKLWAAAKNDSNLPEEIWGDKSNIGTAFGVNAPIINSMKVNVTYHNYKFDASGGEITTKYDVTDENLLVVGRGADLYVPDPVDGRTFEGWTADASDGSAPFSQMIAGLRGDVKLYAVWRVKVSSASIEADGIGMTGNPTDGVSLVFNGNGGAYGISLTPKLTVAEMSKNGDSPQITANEWLRSEEENGLTSPVGTANVHKVENVRDSGYFSVKLKFRSKLEPLFLGEVTSSEIQVTIDPAPLKCSGIKFEDGQPYSGAPYDTAEPTAIVKDEEGRIINGETKWKIVLGRFNNIDDNAENIKDDKETKWITFKPSEEYNGNYGETKDFEVTFPIKYLTFTFYIPKISDLELVVNLEYGQHYTYNNVVNLFEEAFEPYLSVLAGNTPAFVFGEQIIKINDYRKMTGVGNTTTAYRNVTESYRIEVTFVPQTYTVTFDARNGGDNPEPMDIGHGIRIPKPIDPENNGKLFLGWFYDYTDPDTGKKQEAIAWNFDTDRVTREVALYAKWLEATDLVALTVTPSPLIRYIAKEVVDTDYLTVKAKFQGKDGETVLTQEMLLSKGQYQIIYEGGKTSLHAKADPEEKSTITFKYTYNGTTVQAVLEVIVEKIPVDTSVLKQYFKDTAVVKTGGPQKMKEIDPMRISQLLPEIAGCEVTYKYYNSSEDEIDPSQVANVGTYYVRAYFTPDDVDYDAPFIQAVFQIVNEKIKLTVDWGETEFVFNGKAQMPTPTFKDELGDPITANYVAKVTRISNTSVEVEPIKARTDYIITITLEDLAYEIVGDDSTPFAIMPATLKLPTQIKNFPYIGDEYDLNALSQSECEIYFEGFDLDMMRVNAGDGIRGDKGTDAGRYNATLILLDPESSKFEDGTTRTTMTWQIDKAKLTVEWSSYEFYESGGIQIPRVQTLYEFYGNDGKTVDLSKDIEYMGDITAMTSGEYTISVIIKPEAAWISNYELDKSKTCNFVILPRAGMEAISIEWDNKTLFEYNGNVQKPGFRIKNRVGAYIDDIDAGEFRFNEESQNSRWAGDYTMTVTLRPGSNYFLTGKTSCMYTIVINSNGEGNKPDGAGTETPAPPPTDTIDPGKGDTVQLPLWQLIVTGISAVLFVVCTAKALGEYGKMKTAKREAKELASVSYAVSYGFAPLPLLAEIAFLGMGESTWTIIAFVSLGVFLVSLAALMVLSKKRKAAELIVRREQARIDEEKEYMRQEEQLRRDEAQREEQRRRDDEMKMMFAAMQQGFQQQSAMNYGDMQNMIAASMQAMLPAMSQMAALPPAQSDPAAYADPYAQPQYSAPAPQYGAPQQYAAPAPSSDTDELRAKLERQEALINQLLQERQQAAAPAAADYDEDLHDEALWQDGDDVISLEESYGKLSDEAKRSYYDIGSYIMAKPKVAQNDGKYAVLFKYRGKTLFKLCIKGDAPVLYYTADSGARETVRLADATSLNAAKSVIDMCVMRRDRELS